MRVLFVCTGNTCRSPMAAALARRLHPDWEVRSAGLQANQGEPMSDHAVTVLDRRGLPTAHQSTLISRELVEWAERILVMTDAHERRLVTLFPAAGDKVQRLSATDLADPYMGALADYETCADDIEAALKDLP